MSDKRPGDKKPNEDRERERRQSQWRSALVASQFAYTLVIATLLMGWIGHWLGTLLGGAPWTFILMFVLGGAGFGAEMWRMIKFASRKDDDDDSDGGAGNGPDTKFGGTNVDRLPDGPEGDIERPGDDDRRGGDDTERGPYDDDRRGGDDIERPGEDDDRPFAGKRSGRLGPGRPLTQEELAVLEKFAKKGLDALTDEETDTLERILGMNPDGSKSQDGESDGERKDDKKNDK